MAQRQSKIWRRKPPEETGQTKLAVCEHRTVFSVTGHTCIHITIKPNLNKDAGIKITTLDLVARYFKFTRFDLSEHLDLVRFLKASSILN